MLILVLILFVSITFHEYAHGWMASKLGDPTPRQSGRLSLNPLVHIDPFGTIILPILLLAVSTRILGQPFALGYAKPVPINPYHFKNPKNDIALVGLSGPLMNILIAVFLSFLIRIGFPLFTEALVLGVVINLILAIFNLIPVPPLDGSKILFSFLSKKAGSEYLKLEPYGFFIIILLLLIGFFEWFILPLATALSTYLLGIKL
jgi:Zn-dependent protease